MGELIAGIVLICVAHGCDLLSTYIASPSLSREVGPLYVLLAGMGLSGWKSLVGIKVSAILLSAGLFVYYMRRRVEFYPPEPGYSFEEFLHHAHRKDAIRRSDGRWIAPSAGLLTTWLAFVVAIGSAAYAYFLAIHNLLTTPLLNAMRETAAPAAVFIVTALVFWGTIYYDYNRQVRAVGTARQSSVVQRNVD